MSGQSSLNSFIQITLSLPVGSLVSKGKLFFTEECQLLNAEWMIEYRQFAISNEITDSSHDHPWVPKPLDRVVPEKGYSYGTYVSPLRSPVNWKGKRVSLQWRYLVVTTLTRWPTLKSLRVGQPDITCTFRCIMKYIELLWSILANNTIWIESNFRT